MAKVILDWDTKYKKAILVSDFLENIRAEISIPNEKKELMKRKGASWNNPDFFSPITNTGRFSIGMYFEIKKILESNKIIDYEVITTEPLIQQLVQTYSWSYDYELVDLSLPLRPYQESAVKRCIHMGYGICIVGTAGGKTLLMASLIETVRNNEMAFTTLVILPASLLTQTYKEYAEYGLKGLSMWGGKNEFEKTPIMLAGVETLRANIAVFSELKPKTQLKWKSKTDEEFEDANAEKAAYKEYLSEYAKKEKKRKKEWTTKRKYLLDQLKDVDLVLIDEVHGLRKDNVFNKVVSAFPTRHKFGFTGTLPQSPLDQWNVMGQIGPILIDVDSAALREMGYIAQAEIRIIHIEYKNPPELKIDRNNPTKAYEEECSFLYHNEFRHKVISTIGSNFDKNALILVDRLEHGHAILEHLVDATDKKIYFIEGAVAMDDREEIRAIMEEENDIICIAMSRIFSTGINIKNLHYVVFAQGGKAKVTLVQSIGRGLRLHEQKERLIIIDITDATHYGEKHLQERLKYYDGEQIDYETKYITE